MNKNKLNFKEGNNMIDTKILKENIEFISEEVHNAWMEEKRKQGFHSPLECESHNYKSFQKSGEHAKERFYDVGNNPKFYKWCDKCHTDLYPYDELAENIKEYDRVTVRTLIDAIDKMNERK